MSEENPRTYWLQVGDEAIKQATELLKRVEGLGYRRVAGHLRGTLATARGTVTYLRSHGLDDGFEQSDIQDLIDLVKADSEMLTSVKR